LKAYCCHRSYLWLAEPISLTGVEEGETVALSDKSVCWK
jgi:hypothetical protein